MNLVMSRAAVAIPAQLTTTFIAHRSSFIAHRSPREQPNLLTAR
jgi:hypothetical protein